MPEPDFYDTTSLSATVYAPGDADHPATDHPDHEASASSWALAITIHDGTGLVIVGEPEDLAEFVDLIAAQLEGHRGQR